MREAVALDNLVIAPGSKPETDIANLGYVRDDVLACLKALKADDFNDRSTATLTTVRGASRDVLLDSYVTQFKGPNGEIDRLYVKFRVSATWLTLHSFHLATK